MVGDSVASREGITFNNLYLNSYSLLYPIVFTGLFLTFYGIVYSRYDSPKTGFWYQEKNLLCVVSRKVTVTGHSKTDELAEYAITRKHHFIYVLDIIWLFGPSTCDKNIDTSNSIRKILYRTIHKDVAIEKMTPVTRWKSISLR